MNSNLAILVVTCDKYSDLWPIFFELKRKYWRNCEYKTYIGSNYKICDEDGVETICIGNDISWADNVKKMLEYIKEDYVLMLLEDFFIDRDIDALMIKKLVQYTCDNKIDCLRLEPAPGPVRLFERHLKLGYIRPGMPYYVSTQPAIWNKKVLISLLRKGFSAWDFEQKNSADSCKMNYKFVGVRDYVFHHKNGVERGKYYKSTAKFLKQQNIKADIKKRGVINDGGLIAKIKLLKYKFKIYIRCWKNELINRQK